MPKHFMTFELNEQQAPVQQPVQQPAPPAPPAQPPAQPAQAPQPGYGRNRQNLTPEQKQQAKAATLKNLQNLINPLFAAIQKVEGDPNLQTQLNNFATQMGDLLKKAQQPGYHVQGTASNIQ